MNIPIGSDSEAMNLDFSSNFMRVGMNATMGVFDLFEISTAFDFKFELPPLNLGLNFSLADIGLPNFVMPNLPTFDANMLPSISLSGLIGQLPVIVPPSAPAWLLDGLKYIQNIDIRIGLAGITGSITLPDLSINMGDFVYLARFLQALSRPIVCVRHGHRAGPAAGPGGRCDHQLRPLGP